jgi:S1-C subfamily serine protease
MNSRRRMGLIRASQEGFGILPECTGTCPSGQRAPGGACGALHRVQFHRSRSSGFVWRPGLIVTADEALSEEGEYAVTLAGGDTVPAQVAGRDPTTDVALLRTDRSDLQPVPLEATPVPVGARAITLGAEAGTPTAALGVVSRAEGRWRSGGPQCCAHQGRQQRAASWPAESPCDHH